MIALRLLRLAARQLSVVVAAGLLTAGRPAGANPVDVQFVIDPAQSNLTVVAGVSIFNGADSESLEGTIDATLDFGNGGSFDPNGAITVASAEITPSGNYDITIAFVQTVTITDAVADVSTPAPPAAMNRIAGAGVVYQFDAADFLVSLNQGTVTAAGLANATFDLSQEPVTDSAPPGSFGTIGLTSITPVGPYRMVDAVMTLPLEIANTIDVDGTDVDVTASGVVVADATFVVALPPIATDFDADLHVDGVDLAVWATNFSQAAGATTASGDADSDGAVTGADFLLWQRDFGLAPPVVAPLAAIPEPASLTMASVGAALLMVGIRRR